MRILITGMAGFIGSNLADAIPPEHSLVGYDNLNRGDESRRNLSEIRRPFTLFERDIRDSRALKFTCRAQKIDLIYHLAALPSHRLALNYPPISYAAVDLMGTINVLDAAREFGIPVVFASSNKVYGHQPTPFVETMPMLPEGPYGLAKAASEEYCRMFNTYHGVNSVAIRFHHAVGKRCHSELVLAIFTEAALKGEPLIVNGRRERGVAGAPGDDWVWCSADFTNVRDIVNGLVYFIEHPPTGFDQVNFGTGKAHTVLELAQMVLAETKSKSPIVKGVAMPHEGLSHLADTNKAKTKYGFEAKIELEDSVKEYIDWRKSL
jgi:nucleoside-diphosphate-sugar epimerase